MDDLWLSLKVAETHEASKCTMPEAVEDALSPKGWMLEPWSLAVVPHLGRTGWSEDGRVTVAVLNSDVEVKTRRAVRVLTRVLWVGKEWLFDTEDEARAARAELHAQLVSLKEVK